MRTGIVDLYLSMKNKELENKAPTRKKLVEIKENIKRKSIEKDIPKKKKLTPALDSTSINIFKFRKLDKKENIILKKLQKIRKYIEKFQSKSRVKFVKINKK